MSIWQRLTRCRWSNPAKNAYDSAIETLKKELTLDEYETVWLGNCTTVIDVQNALSAAQQQYEGKTKGSKVRKWLSSCSSRIMYYGSKFLVLVSCSCLKRNG